MRGTRGATLAILMLLTLAACGGTGNRRDTDYDGGKYLPLVQQADTGWQTLEVTSGETITDGRFSRDGNDLVLADPYSGTAIKLIDNSNVRTAEQIYDTDGNRIPNYIVVTIRALSAQAAACVTAYDGDDNLIAPASFIKVGGAAFLPLDATFSAGVEITLPVHPSATPTPGKVFDLYKFVDNTLDGRETSSDVGTGTGHWEYVSQVNVDGSGSTVTFNTGSLGQYCIATDTITHSQGGGTDL
jgi:hypothetical protein